MHGEHISLGFEGEKSRLFVLKITSVFNSLRYSVFRCTVIIKVFPLFSFVSAIVLLPILFLIDISLRSFFLGAFSLALFRRRFSFIPFWNGLS